MSAEPQPQLWLTWARVLTFRDFVAIELHQRIAFGFSFWRWYAGFFFGPVVVVIGKRPLTGLENLTENEAQMLDLFRDLEADSAAKGDPA